mgnify:FL=1
MRDNAIVDSFLEEFKELEVALAKAAGQVEGFSSYTKNLQQCYSQRRIPLLQVDDNFAFLKSCAEVRNLLVHSRDICVPTSACLERFIELSQRIRFPKRAGDIATRGNHLLTATLKNPILTLAKRMVAKGLSHVPVIEEGKLLGIFSATSFFDLFNQEGTLSLDAETTLERIRDQISICNHRSETFIFCRPDTILADFASLLGRKGKQKRRVAAVLVTEDGSASGKLVGIITASDLVKA